jgi:valyl-tRNA synthetase
VAADVLREVRRHKTEAKVSMRAEIARATVTDTDERLAALALIEGDIREAGKIAELVTAAGEFAVSAELAPTD